MTHFPRCVHSKSIEVLSLRYYELIGKIEEHEGKNICWLMIICQTKYQIKLKKKQTIDTFDDTEILIDSDDKLPGDITL